MLAAYPIASHVGKKIGLQLGMPPSHIWIVFLGLVDLFALTAMKGLILLMALVVHSGCIVSSRVVISIVQGQTI